MDPKIAQQISVNNQEDKQSTARVKYINIKIEHFYDNRVICEAVAGNRRKNEERKFFQYPSHKEIKTQPKEIIEELIWFSKERLS